MNEVVKRTVGNALMGAAVLAYFSRPWSCGLALSQFTPQDSVPYAYFDYHGWGVMLAWLLALLFAAPLLWLASKLFLRSGAQLRVFGRARDTKTTILSIAIALGIGTPMHSQLCYLIGLPTNIMAPILISSLAWLLVVEVGRTAAVERNLLDKSAVHIAAGLAIIVTVPKLALIGLSFMPS
jgi:hypothetical protein